jgi:O-antigen ligase
VPDLLGSGGANDDYLTILIEQGVIGLALTLAWLVGSLWIGIRTCMRLPKYSSRRMLIAGFTAAVLGYAIAMTGHDASHDWPMLSMAAFVTGTLVSLCSLPGGASDRTWSDPIAHSTRLPRGEHLAATPSGT